MVNVLTCCASGRFILTDLLHSEYAQDFSDFRRLQKPISKTASFCRFCGKKQPASQTPPAAQGYTPAQQTPPAAQGYTPAQQTPLAAQGYTPAQQVPPAAQGYTPAQQTLPVKRPVNPPQTPGKVTAADFDQTSVIPAASPAPNETIRPDAYQKQLVPGGGGKQYPVLKRLKTGESAQVNKDIFRIGTVPGVCDWAISGNSSISHIHAAIFARDGKYYLIDQGSHGQGSTNGTFFNNERLPVGLPQELSDQSVFRLADEEFIFSGN